MSSSNIPSIDVRQLRLSKWILPKTQNITTIDFSSGANLSASCFGVVEVFPVQDDRLFPGDHTGDTFHTKHSICLYAPAKTDAQRSRIQNFWRLQQSSAQPLYVCMVRLADNACDPLSHISWALEQKAQLSKSNFLCYYSLDFCDLVLFVHGIRFQQYLAAVNILNFCAESDQQRIVRDTISIYAIRPDALTGPVPDKAQWDRINVTLRLGVLDFAQLDRFYQELQKELSFSDPDPDVSCELSLGRSDFTLYARGKDYPWIIRLCRVLDRYTGADIGDGKPEAGASGFLTFEISLGVDYAAISPDIQAAGSLVPPSNPLSKLYSKARRLGSACKECQDLLEQNHMDSACLFEIYLALTDLLKDGFALDFVLSVYESFWHLCSYINEVLHEQMQTGRSVSQRQECIQGLLESYTSCLSTIVNCTMHSDREFIQVPSFNLFLQPVPPKLLAFYTAIANQIAKLLSTDGQEDSRFTFLFVPSYKDGINVSSLMPADELNDRILAIHIHEKLLLAPKKLLPLIGHEIGHYVGTGARKREFRTECYLDSLLSYELDRAFFSEMFGPDEAAALAELCAKFAHSLRAVIMQQRSQEFQDHLFSHMLNYVRQSHYLLDFLDDEVMIEVIPAWIEILWAAPEETRQCFVSKWSGKLDRDYTKTGYLQQLWSSEGNCRKKECLRVICEWCYRQILATFEDNSEYDQLFSWYNWLENAYRESYSDVVMLSLLNLTKAGDYKTILDQNLTPDTDSEYNILRVSAVTAVLGGTDPGWLNMEPAVQIRAFQHCALARLTEYLKQCQAQLQAILNDRSPLGSIYETLRSDACDAGKVFSLFCKQCQAYLEHLWALPEIDSDGAPPSDRSQTGNFDRWHDRP